MTHHRLYGRRRSTRLYATRRKLPSDRCRGKQTKASANQRRHVNLPHNRLPKTSNPNNNAYYKNGTTRGSSRRRPPDHQDTSPSRSYHQTRKRPRRVHHQTLSRRHKRSGRQRRQRRRQATTRHRPLPRNLYTNVQHNGQRRAHNRHRRGVPHTPSFLFLGRAHALRFRVCIMVNDNLRNKERRHKGRAETGTFPTQLIPTSIPSTTQKLLQANFNLPRQRGSKSQTIPTRPLLQEERTLSQTKIQRSSNLQQQFRSESALHPRTRPTKTSPRSQFFGKVKTFCRKVSSTLNEHRLYNTRQQYQESTSYYNHE